MRQILNVSTHGWSSLFIKHMVVRFIHSLVVTDICLIKLKISKSYKEKLFKNRSIFLIKTECIKIYNLIYIPDFIKISKLKMYKSYR